ncbi:hypothetical protein [Bacillus sp. 03113]|nr:hypothetical protein [Bacillus sp. 03113]
MHFIPDKTVDLKEYCEKGMDRINENRDKLGMRHVTIETKIEI